jgi:hypothetical protein
MTKQINGDKPFVVNPHPAIPPADQLKKWEDKWFNEEEHADVLLIQAFQAGADQELEACVEWAVQNGYNTIPPRLRVARRPKPPSLKEQALEVFEALIHGDANGLDVGVIRRALEALPND